MIVEGVLTDLGNDVVFNLHQSLEYVLRLYLPGQDYGKILWSVEFFMEVSYLKTIAY